MNTIKLFRNVILLVLFGVAAMAQYRPPGPVRPSEPYRPGYGGNQGIRTVLCSSNGGQMAQCYVGQGYVRILRQVSSAACNEGYSWGYDPRSGYIWVNGGCRAEFEVMTNNNSYPGSDTTITCASEGGRLNSCLVNFRRITRADILQQISKAPCIFNQSWGYDSNRIWVNNGCRAVFRVVGR